MQEMSQFFFGNFDFEHSLAGGNNKSLPASVLQINAELATCWMLVAEEGDVIFLPEPVDGLFWKRMEQAGFPKVRTILSGSQTARRHFSDKLQFVPWGWSNEMVQFAEQHQFVYQTPAFEIIQQANSREFSAMLEDELGIALPAAQMISYVEDLSHVLKQLPQSEDNWVIKNNFSNSARERIIGQGKSISQSAQNWMQKRWNKNALLFFEPWVDSIEEVGIHLTIPVSGEPVFDGITPLLTDHQGRYCGSRVFSEKNNPTSIRWQTVIDIGFKVAARLQRIGYFGPVGIDAMRFRQPDGTMAVRPLQEINARWTMGRIALGIQKMLQPNEVGSWLHYSSLNQFPLKADSDEIRIIPTSPTTTHGKPVRHQTCICISKNVDFLEKCEQRLFNRVQR